MKIVRWSFPLALLAACGASTSGPVSVEAGKDACAACGQPVRQIRFAAQIRLGPERVDKFDHVGCLFARLAAVDAPEPLEVWVWDFGLKDWIDARTAHYVYDTDFETGEGVPVGYRDLEDAQAQARRNQDRVQSFEQARGYRRW